MPRKFHCLKNVDYFSIFHGASNAKLHRSTLICAIKNHKLNVFSTVSV